MANVLTRVGTTLMTVAESFNSPAVAFTFPVDALTAVAVGGFEQPPPMLILELYLFFLRIHFIVTLSNKGRSILVGLTTIYYSSHISLPGLSLDISGHSWYQSDDYHMFQIEFCDIRYYKEGVFMDPVHKLCPYICPPLSRCIISCITS